MTIAKATVLALFALFFLSACSSVVFNKTGRAPALSPSDNSPQLMAGSGLIKLRF
jgi:hypothetical protein